MTRSSWQKKRAKKWSTMLCSIRCKTKDSLVHVTHKIIFFPEILLRWRIMRFVERQRLPSNLSKMLHKFLNKVVVMTEQLYLHMMLNCSSYWICLVHSQHFKWACSFSRSSGFLLECSSSIYATRSRLWIRQTSSLFAYRR